MPQQFRRGGSPGSDAEQGEQSLTVLIQRKDRGAKGVALHMREHGPRAENEPLVADLGGAADRFGPDVFFKSLVERLMAIHASLLTIRKAM
ncbi:hypothetical protein DSM21852_14060 [Methylocystis bryophila]|nr:hypothetical protein DSM21852_14060 [Methylocystis bryophila]